MQRSLAQDNYVQTRLEHTYRSLDARIKKLDRRGIRMTPSERLLARKLKRDRLAILDQLSAIR